MQSSWRLAPLLLLLVLLAACGPDAGTADDARDDLTSPTPASEATTGQAVPAGSQLVVRELARRPHDPDAFTQGLEFHDGRLFESRGLRDEPMPLTEINPLDGTAIIGQAPREPPEDPYFAEGLTVVDDRIIQLTWREQVAFVHDVDTLERIGEFAYEGEGWGICDEPDRLVMSDGTSTLTLRDRDTFEVIRTVTVTLDGQPLDQINELECVDGLVWANIWQTPTIVVIEPDTGEVVSVVDASSIANRNGRWIEDPSATDVLNGIAYDPDTGTWLLTGKLWPWMLEVAFDCIADCDDVTVTPSHYVRPTDLPPSRDGA